MAGQLKILILVPALAALLLVSGCSGVLMESTDEDGRVSRLKVDTGESWDAYDEKPRPNVNVKSTPKNFDEMSIMLKKEATF